MRYIFFTLNLAKEAYSPENEHSPIISGEKSSFEIENLLKVSL